MPILTAQNAIIKTAGVEIKTLTVAGKQVTLALFRQLIEDHIFDFKTGQLKGVGWGHVRYLVPDGYASAEVRNLVWQQGDELRRCLLHRTLKPRWTPENAKDLIDDPFYYRGYDAADFRVRFIETAWGAYGIDDDIPETFKLPHPYSTRPELERENRIAIDDFTALVRQNLIPKLKHVLAITAAYDSLTPALFDLPQLFIAA